MSGPMHPTLLIVGKAHEVSSRLKGTNLMSTNMIPPTTLEVGALSPLPLNECKCSNLYYNDYLQFAAVADKKDVESAFCVWPIEIWI